MKRFNTRALFDTMDAQRIQRGLTWTQVSRETGVSTSTLTGTKMGGRLEVDGTLAMTNWLGRTIESFAQESQ